LTTALGTDRVDSSIDQSDPTPGVLLVDDDLAVRRFVGFVLTQAGYRVFAAQNLGDASNLFGLIGRRIRVALLDVSMPGGDGPEVLRELRRVSPDLPAVFMSGELDPGLTNALADRLRQEGADGLIAKPVGAAALIAVLSDAVARRSARPPRCPDSSTKSDHELTGRHGGDRMSSRRTDDRGLTYPPLHLWPAVVTEVTLLLPEAQAAALGLRAEAGGVTTGTLIRRILTGYLSAGPDQPVRADRRADETARQDFDFGAIAHELGNALTPLVLGAEVAQKAGPDTAVGRAACVGLCRQAAHLRAVLQGMLDLHRADHGRVVLNTVLVDLPELAGRAADTVGGIALERGHRLTVRVDPDVGPLRADPVRLEQILVNLLTNAVRYTEPGGEVSLAAARDGDEVTIRVRDTGVGIPPHVLPRVFDGSAPGGVTRGGLGIGLLLVRRLVELHGGRVAAASGGPGTGSEFVVTLPAGE
jgi:signal transduction histidine kinase/CheY-like chemotaxis protein